jgi:hypothetical protein
MMRSSLTLTALIGFVVATSHAQQPATDAALTASDYLEIEQLVYEYGWALDSGENDGYAYADLYTPDGIFTGTNQGPSGRSYQGRDNLAALARGPQRGPLSVRHLVTNLIVTPTPDGAQGRVYVGIFDPGEPGARPGAGHGGYYDDVYAKTPDGWRFRHRTFYEGKWGEPNVSVPPPVPGVRALREPASVAASAGRIGNVEDHIAIQQLVARLPYEVDMNADDGAAYASAFTLDGTFACVLPDTGDAAPVGLPQGCAPYTGTFTTDVPPIARGRDALARLASQEPHGPNYARHFIFNHVIDLNGNEATGKAYVAVIDIMPRQQGADHSIFLLGRYDDAYVKTEDGWRIESRILTAVAGGAPATVK